MKARPGKRAADKPKLQCPKCKQYVSAVGLADHYQMTHVKADRRELRKVRASLPHEKNAT